jgi:hypothetical protein
MPRVKERDFLNWVIAVAERTGWSVWHVPAPMVASRKGGFVPSSRGAGLPDLIMLHDDPPTLIFAEVKGSGGSLSIPQARFLRLARSVGRQDDLIPHQSGVGAYLWSPGDEEMIETILKTRILA